MTREQAEKAGLQFSEDEQEALNRGPKPPFRITGHWLSLLNGEKNDPLRIQSVPRTEEYCEQHGESADPLGEESHSPFPRLICRYNDRALVVVTGTCALYCRHCFRRRLTGEDYGDLSLQQAKDIGKWLADHQEVKELLLSGGDPLTLSDRDFFERIRILRDARPDIVLRLATRMPIVEPRRISRSLVRRLTKIEPLWIVIQCNHPRELSPEALRALGMLRKAGMPLLNQAVLLKGVNDDVGVLEDLSRALVSAGVKPYYLFQGDLAAGTGHFRLPLDEARLLVDELRQRLSGLAMPAFAVDLPGGGGKVPLTRNYVTSAEDGSWHLRTPDGVEGFYFDPPNEEIP